MKTKLLFLLLSVFTLGSFAQAPTTFSYQAVVRDGDGNPMPNKNVSFRMSIVDAEFGGDELYVETHDTITNQFGMVNLYVGLGNVVSGNIEEILWGLKAFYLQIELDQNGGKNYKLMNKAELINSIFHKPFIKGGDNWYEIVVDSAGNLGTKKIVLWDCGDIVTDERDGQEYPTVQIGNQCWLAKNMNIGYKIPGSINRQTTTPSKGIVITIPSKIVINMVACINGTR